MGAISHDIHHPVTARADTGDLSGWATILSFRDSSENETATSCGVGSSLLDQSVSMALGLPFITCM